jgi:pimeloyl-ACP methyl ester carboxylesterase
MIPAPFQIASQLVRDLTAIATGAVADASGAAAVRPPPALMPTPRDVIAREGTAALYRFAPPAGVSRRGRPVLLVPSLINQWYVLDLRRGASLVAALVEAGLDVFCLDWGAPEDEDRHRTWDDVLGRLDRMVRRTLRTAGATQLGLVGYCMGGTLAAIYGALHPTRVAALVDLAGPIDFAKGGMLRTMVDRRWFDADAIADAGNVSPEQMQSGFTALRPTLELAKAVGAPELMLDRSAHDALRAPRRLGQRQHRVPGRRLPHVHRRAVSGQPPGRRHPPSARPRRVAGRDHLSDRGDRRRQGHDLPAGCGHGAPRSRRHPRHHRAAGPGRSRRRRGRQPRRPRAVSRAGHLARGPAGGGLEHRTV